MRYKARRPYVAHRAKRCRSRRSCVVRVVCACRFITQVVGSYSQTFVAEFRPPPTHKSQDTTRQWTQRAEPHNPPRGTHAQHATHKTQPNSNTLESRGHRSTGRPRRPPEGKLSRRRPRPRWRGRGHRARGRQREASARECRAHLLNWFMWFSLLVHIPRNQVSTHCTE